MSKVRTATPHINVVSDSLNAVSILNGTIPARPTARQGTERIEELVYQFKVLGTRVTFEWVRGHNGHALNELADRASRAGRRCAEYRLENKAVFLARIRGEAAALSTYPATSVA